MHNPLDYAQPNLEPLPHCELGELSLAFTGIWIGCFSSALAVNRWMPIEQLVAVLAAFTLMAMAIFVPMGFVVAVLGLTEQNRRQRYAYLCASINGCVLTAVALGLMWDVFP